MAAGLDLASSILIEVKDQLRMTTKGLGHNIYCLCLETIADLVR